MSIFMHVVNQARELAKGRGRISFVIDLEKWLPMRATQAQPEDTWRVSWFESIGTGAARCSAKGRDAQEALVRVVAGMTRGQAAQAEEAEPDVATRARDVLEDLAKDLHAVDRLEIAATIDRAIEILKSTG